MRSSFFMPVGTKVGLTPVASITPAQIFSDDVTSLFISSNDIVNGPWTVNIGGADPATYDAIDFGSAQRIIQQINNAMQSGTGSPVLIIEIPTTLTWTSLTPNTFQAGTTGLFYTVAGTGFLASGVNDLKLSNESNSYPSNAFITDDGTMTDDSALDYTLVDGNYTLYYSTDQGVTWNTTGLTAVIS